MNGKFLFAILTPLQLVVIQAVMVEAQINECKAEEELDRLLQ